MSKNHSLAYQAKQQLISMQAFGQSKHADKAENHGKPAMEKIYSYKTMDNYIKSAANFAHWVKEQHPDCRSIDDARQYTGDYLRERTEDKSAWTVRADAAALGKLYQCATTDLGAELPSRHSADVTQHRTDAWRGHFSEERNADLVEFCRSSGLRRCEVERITPADVSKDADGRVIVHGERGKGGKSRDVVALSDAPLRLAEAATEEGRDRIIEHIPKYAPIHEYRAEYAREMYRNIARNVAELDRSEVYRCRESRRGETYDQEAMLEVSRN